MSWVRGRKSGGRRQNEPGIIQEPAERRPYPFVSQPASIGGKQQRGGMWLLDQPIVLVRVSLQHGRGRAGMGNVQGRDPVSFPSRTIRTPVRASEVAAVDAGSFTDPHPGREQQPRSGHGRYRMRHAPTTGLPHLQRSPWTSYVGVEVRDQTRLPPYWLIILSGGT